MRAANYVIAVGIDHYVGLASLRGAENDARAFAEWAQNPCAHRVEPEHVQLIVSSQFPKPVRPVDLEPVFSTVERAFRHIASLGIAKGYLGPRLYVFLAGHGFADSWEDARLYTAEGDFRRFIPGRLFAGELAAAGYFDEVVLFMDCCRESVAGFSPPISASWQVREGKVETRTYYALATKYSARTPEKCVASGRYHGVFTLTLLEGLRGAGVNDSGDVDGMSLALYLKETLPNCEVTVDKPETFVFAEGIGVPLVSTLIHAPSWPPVVVTDGERRFEGTTLRDGSIRLDLPPGLYIVSQTDDDRRAKPFRVTQPGPIHVEME